jgi:membrane protein YqaA with SNARE-associated domain
MGSEVQEQEGESAPGSPMPHASPTANPVSAPPADPGAQVSRWAIHRRLYDWVLSLAQRKHATTALFAISFAESSFFPIPPDVLLLPMCLGRRARAWWFAAVCTIGSVLGGVAGWLIGWGAWEALDEFVYRWIPSFTPESFAKVSGWYQQYGLWVVFIAAFTPIPYKVFTIAAGVFHMSIPGFVVISLIGRGLRFFLEAALMYWFGPRILPFIDRYFNLLCITFAVLLVGGFALIKAFGH